MDLEDLRELDVLGCERLVDARLPDEHHLEVDRDRLGLQRAGVRARALVELADLEQPRLQHALELGPDAGLCEHVEAPQHEVTALGAQQRARVDPRRAEPGLVAGDGAEQVPEARVGLDDDRTLLAGRRLDHLRLEVHEVRVLAGLARLDGRAVLVGLDFGADEPRQVLFDELPRGVEPVRDLRLGPAGDEVALVALEDLPGHLQIHRPDLLLRARELLVDPLADLVEPLDQLIPVSQQPVPVLIGELALEDQRRQRVQRDRLAVHHRVDVGRRRARLRLERDDRAALLLSLPLQRVHHAPLARRAGAADHAARHPVRTRAQRADQRAVHGLAQRQKVVAEPPSGARGERDQQRPIGLAEVVQEHPVRHLLPRRLDVAEQHPHDRGAPRPHQPGDEQVVALRADREPGPKGGHRPLLTDQEGRRRRLPGGLQRLAGPAQLLHRHGAAAAASATARRSQAPAVVADLAGAAHARATSTGHGAALRISPAVLPSSAFMMPVRPWERTTIKSTRSTSASLRICSSTSSEKVR